MLNFNVPSSITKLRSKFLDKKSIDIFIKRDDLIHNIVTGNKWRKLKYNLQEAQDLGYSTVLSFGGAYSNYLHALSYATNQLSINSVGIVRGEKHVNLNTTLSFCKSQKMLLYYLNRQDYKINKYSKNQLKLFKELFGDFYMIPEGGNNLLGVKGAEEILQEVNLDFDYICCAVGTGCTAAGLIKSLKKNQYLLGFCPFPKVIEQKKNIMNFCNFNSSIRWKLLPDYHFKGFGRINKNLTDFIYQFNLDYNIELDLIYMGKLFYSLFDLIQKDTFLKNTRILVLHSGGLQGLDGFNFSFK